MLEQSVPSIVIQVTIKREQDPHLFASISRKKTIIMTNIIFMILCLIASFDFNDANGSFREESGLKRSNDVPVSALRNVEETPNRISRKFRGNSRTRRLHIENQHGFDGKVEEIHVNSAEDFPDVKAYELQKKNRLNNDHVDKINGREMMKEFNDTSRITRSIEAYGKNKENLDMNGHIERVQPAAPSSRYQSPINVQTRATRSIETQSKKLDDLETQDSKIFRPLFVYRQQVAKRHRGGRNQIYGFQGGRRRFRNIRPIF